MIELQGIGNTYRRATGEAVRALDELSLHIDRGEFVAIVGASGSGKSTLMNIIGLLDVPSDGRYLFNGQDAAHLSVGDQARLRNQKIGFVFQAFHLLPRTSALENVELPLIYSDRASIKGLGRAALEAVSLGDRLHHTPSELSGGQQQRVAIARALVNDPELLMADEPTGNLDAEAAREIMAIFQTLNRSGRTIVLVTHLRARTRTHSANAAPLFRATGEPRWILESRDGDDLECLRHRRERVQQVNEIVNLGPEFHGHRCLVYHLACVVTDYRHAQHFVCVDVDRHLDDSARVADCARAGHDRHRERVAPAPMTGGDRLLLGHADHRYFRVGEDRSRDHTMIDRLHRLS